MKRIGMGYCDEATWTGKLLELGAMAGYPL